MSGSWWDTVGFVSLRTREGVSLPVVVCGSSYSFLFTQRDTVVATSLLLLLAPPWMCFYKEALALSKPSPALLVCQSIHEDCSQALPLCLYCPTWANPHLTPETFAHSLWYLLGTHSDLPVFGSVSGNTSPAFLSALSLLTLCSHVLLWSLLWHFSSLAFLYFPDPRTPQVWLCVHLHHLPGTWKAISYLHWAGSQCSV